MLKFITKRWAKIRYVFNQHVEAATNDLNASLALRTGDEKRTRAVSLKTEADEMDARIKEVGALEERGYWLCENGHENTEAPAVPQDEGHQITCVCGKLMKLIKRDLMAGQEKYESDKERGEAQKIADQKREQAKAEEDGAGESERTAKYFRNLAQGNRNVADKIRAL
ncbi:MAG TPA: hypothetical protein VGI45_24850 [Terracidiphilus sp.]|jgi:hypothetical protein